ncbi:uncharacterized protein LOC118467677 [Anopheles albimanus]|uniref:uncharacterized protein LOC118467677 n=1 Tax=Anopheles albimanus TaxID=7167 RepID=UPI00163EB794|nr:uncharacterized protein LOC118467677 [Anopheles albimanus]
MPDSSRTTLGDIEDIDSGELKDQLKRWIEEEGIEANIQLQMKKNLIDKMSRTTLGMWATRWGPKFVSQLSLWNTSAIVYVSLHTGRKIALKLQTQHGIVLSPLVLVLNTLVAEFLYTQNCHFSLSIFTNEIPFKNTLPDFTRSPKFRLDRSELSEIFEALGIDHYAGLMAKYEKLGSHHNSQSLLYIVFKSILSSVKAQEAKLRRLQRVERQKTNARTLLKRFEIKKLHCNVEKLLHRVKLVGKGIAQLEESHRNVAADATKPTGILPVANGVAASSKRQEETLSLQMCSENVSRLVVRLESCTKMFEQLLSSLNVGSKHDAQATKSAEASTGAPCSCRESKKTYTDFLQELKSTEHGKRYVAKLQKQVMKLLDQEKKQVQERYAKKVQVLEREHKDMVEKILSRPSQQESISPKQQGTTAHVDTNSEDVSHHFMKKIDEKLDQLHQHERNVDSKLVMLRSDLQRHEQHQSRYFESLKAAKTREGKLQVLQNVERELLATFEDETNAIIQNAKTTIEQLEKESDKINHSFQQYLQKQREDKRRLIEEKVQIWTKYNDEKLELNQRELLNGRLCEKDPPLDRPVSAATVTDGQIPVQHADKPTSAASTFRSSHFENPFKSFDPLRYLRQSRPIEHRMVDIAIGTTADTGQQTSCEDRQAEDATPVHVEQRPRANESIGLGETLAKDTRNLRQSIEENLQKLDEMSRIVAKSDTSSSKPNGSKRTYDIQRPAQLMPTVEPSSNRSLDDCSSLEMGLSEGEVVQLHVPPEQERNPQRRSSSPKLDTTRDILDYTTQNILNECAAEKPQLNGKTRPVMSINVASLSDLSISTISQLSCEKSQSLDGELDRISTGIRSHDSEGSWS